MDVGHERIFYAMRTARHLRVYGDREKYRKMAEKIDSFININILMLIPDRN